MDIPMAHEVVNVAAQAEHKMSLRQKMGAIGMAVLPLAGASCVAAPAPVMSEAAFVRTVEINNIQAPTDAELKALRGCEATGNYGATNKTGKYMGAYQFDQTTWNGVVGGAAGLNEFVGVKPNKAPAGVQDAAARVLYAHRGPKPWPECGRFLKPITKKDQELIQFILAY